MNETECVLTVVHCCGKKKQLGASVVVVTTTFFFLLHKLIPEFEGRLATPGILPERLFDVEIGNEWVVPYNPYLLLRFNCHICTDILSGSSGTC